jgi:hypothetical protein
VPIIVIISKDAPESVVRVLSFVSILIGGKKLNDFNSKKIVENNKRKSFQYANTHWETATIFFFIFKKQCNTADPLLKRFESDSSLIKSICVQ